MAQREYLHINWMKFRAAIDVDVDVERVEVEGKSQVRAARRGYKRRISRARSAPEIYDIIYSTCLALLYLPYW